MVSGIRMNSVPAIVCAPDALSKLHEYIAELASVTSVLVILDPNIAELPSVAAATDKLRFRGIHPTIKTLPRGEPTEAAVASLLQQTRPARPQAVVCIGGGSVMDGGKLLACLLHDDCVISVLRLAAQPMPARRIPLICCPTTSGTGSEVTTTSILSDDNGVKFWFWSEWMRPDLVVLDPKMTLKLPQQVSVETGLDALVHAIEAATNRNASDANDMYCFEAVRRVIRYLPRVVKDPSDIAARAGMQWAATYAGIAIDNAGTGVAHNVGHALGSLCKLPHGRAVAVGLGATLAWSLEGYEERYEVVARSMGLTSPQQLPTFFLNFAEEVGVRFKLGENSASAAQLAYQMMRKENLPMANSSIRPVDEETFHLLANRVAALTGMQ